MRNRSGVTVKEENSVIVSRSQTELTGITLWFCNRFSPRFVMDVICTNDRFPAPVLSFYAEFGITTPKKDQLYTIRQVKRHTTGETGVLLNEIQNPDVPVKHPIMGEVWFEPTFNVNRFATLMGQPVREEEMADVNV